MPSLPVPADGLNARRYCIITLQVNQYSTVPYERLCPCRSSRLIPMTISMLAESFSRHEGPPLPVRDLAIKRERGEGLCLNDDDG